MWIQLRARCRSIRDSSPILTGCGPTRHGWGAATVPPIRIATHKEPRDMHTTLFLWLTLAGLGAFHGLNPGMGWLFAVALGMQEAKRSAVWRALIPLTLGHGLAIAAAIGVAIVVGTALSPGMLRWPVALLLPVWECGSYTVTY